MRLHLAIIVMFIYDIIVYFVVNFIDHEWPIYFAFTV